MLYFKNHDLAEMYHVSDRTVRNWIEAAKQGKLKLTLHEAEEKHYIANVPKNLAAIEELVNERKKYRPHHTFKVITPRPEFYKLYNPGQIYDILSNLELHHEIPRQYNYFNGGADDWNAYATRLASEDTANNVTASVALLEQLQSYVDSKLGKFKHVNVIDIGGGNALPVKSLLAFLVDRGVMGRYIDLDISTAMLDIAERNVKKWFGNKVPFEGYETDINYDRFANILAEDYLKPDTGDTLNLIMLLGGTLANFRAPDGPLRIIHDSMGLNDLLVYVKKLDSEATRRYFDFSRQPGDGKLPSIHGLVIELLNIDKELYDLEAGYDSLLRMRYERIRFKIAATIKFSFDEGVKYINLNKGDAVLVWRAWQQSAMEIIQQFDRNDFYLLHSNQTDDHEYILTVSCVKSE